MFSPCHLVHGGGSREVGSAACCPTSAELVIVGLQQGLGDIPWLTAGQVLTGALLLWFAAAAAAAATTVTATWQVSVVLLFPVLLGLLLKEEADLLEGRPLGRLQVPAGLHNAVYVLWCKNRLGHLVSVLHQFVELAVHQDAWVGIQTE